MCSVCRMLLDKDYVFGVQDVALQGLCARCAGCCSTRTVCSVCRMLPDKDYVFGVQVVADKDCVFGVQDVA